MNALSRKTDITKRVLAALSAVSILFLPDYSDGNPYQSNLAVALDEDVTYGREASSVPVLRALIEDDISLVHVHWLNLFFKGDSTAGTALKFGLLLVRLLAIRLAGIPVVWTVHNVTMHEAEHPWLERRFKRWFITSGACDRLILHCEAVEERLFEELDLPESARNQIDVVPHGHYLDNYENDISRREARASFDIGDSETVFLFFGMIRRYKGVLNLIDTYRGATVPNSRLLVAGKPATERLRSELRQRAGDDDRIRGVYEFVPDDEIQRYMAAADAVVLPYRDITTSGSAVLAMSFGKALVVPPLGCLPELLDEDGTVFYDPDDPDGLRGALERAPDRDLTAMGAYNERTVRQYDWAWIGQLTQATYAKARGEKPEEIDGRASEKRAELVSGPGQRDL